MHLFSSKSLHKIALLGAGTAITAIIGRSGGNARSMVLSVAALTTAAVILFGGDVYGVGKRKRGEEEETVDPEMDWIHQHVFTADHILKNNPTKCCGREGNNCKLVAICKWSNGTSTKHYCMDCQADTFGGWPADVVFNLSLPRVYRDAMLSKCTNKDELNMPKFNVLAGLLDGTLDDTDRNGFSNNQANPLDTSQFQSHKDLVKLENLALDEDVDEVLKDVDEVDEDEDEVDEDEDEDEAAVRFMF